MTGTQVRGYPYLTAARAIDGFVDCYSRATCFLAKKLQLSPMDLRKILIKQFMYMNARWNVTRDIIKWIDREDMFDELARLEYKLFVKYLTSVKTLVEDDILFGE